MLSANRRGIAFALGIALLVAAINLAWLGQFRQGYPLNYDEAAFMAMARYDSLRLVTLGPIGLARAFVVQGPAAPLVPLISVPVQVLGGASNLPSFGVIQVFLVLLTLACYGLAARLGGPLAGVLAAIAISTAPGVIYFSRMYHYAVPSTALLALTLYALLRGEGFSQRRWAVAWGLTLGALVLTRSVALALAPGIVLAGAVTLVTGREQRSRLGNMLLGLVVAVVVAATWYWHNLAIVLEYLTVSGYGASSALYGEARSVMSVEFWLARLGQLIQQGLFVPLAAVLFALTLAGVIARLARQPRFRATHPSDARVLGIVLLTSYAALSSSANVGSGFVLLLLPLLIPLLVALACGMSSPFLRACCAGALGAVALGNLIMTSAMPTELAQPRWITIPLLGGLPLTDGRSDIQTIIELAGYEAGPPGGPIPPEHLRWTAIDRELGQILANYAETHGTAPIAALASRDPLITTGSVRLAGLLFQQENRNLVQLSGDQPDDSLASYQSRMADLSPVPNVLIAADPGPAEYQPRVTQILAEDAAISMGFQLERVIELPGGRAMRIWWRAPL